MNPYKSANNPPTAAKKDSDSEKTLKELNRGGYFIFLFHLSQTGD